MNTNWLKYAPLVLGGIAGYVLWHLWHFRSIGLPGMQLISHAAYVVASLLRRLGIADIEDSGWGLLSGTEMIFSIVTGAVAGLIFQFAAGGVQRWRCGPQA